MSGVLLWALVGAVHLTLGLLTLGGGLASPGTPRQEETLSGSWLVSVDTSKFTHETHPRFLSVAIDSSLIYYRWEGLDFRYCIGAIIKILWYQTDSMFSLLLNKNYCLVN